LDTLHLDGRRSAVYLLGRQRYPGIGSLRVAIGPPRPSPLAASVFDLDPRRPEAQAMTGTEPYVSDVLGHLEVETTEIRDLSPPSAAAALAS
jgi:hypothetical protein